MSRFTFQFSLLLSIVQLSAVLRPESCVAADQTDGSWFVRVWQTDTGLPNNDVTGVVQSQDGTLIVGTPSGLVRFDGWRFRDCESLSEGQGGRGVAGLGAGRSGTVWFVSRGKLKGWSQDGPLRQFPFPGLPAWGRATRVLEARDGGVWVSLDTGLALRLTGDKLEPTAGAAGLPEKFAHSVVEDESGTLWAAGNGCLSQWDGSRFVKAADLPPGQPVLAAARSGGVWIGVGMRLLRHVAGSVVQEVGVVSGAGAGARIMAMLEDDAGRIWCGTFGAGLHCWQGGRFERVAVPHHDVMVLSQDREGNLWAGTSGGGLARVRPQAVRLVQDPAFGGGLTPRSLCRDSQGQLWVVSHSGSVHRHDGKKWQRLPLDEQLRGMQATCVAAGPSGAVWLGTSGGRILHLDGALWHQEALPASETLERIHSLLVAGDGEVWAGRAGGLLRRRGETWDLMRQGAVTEVVGVLAQDEAGRVWAGTSGGRIWRAAAGKVDDVSAKDQAVGGIRCLLPSEGGVLWIGSDRGLHRWKDGNVVPVPLEQGMNHTSVNQLTAGSGGVVWAGGNMGLFRLDLAALRAAAEGGAEPVRCVSYALGENASGLQTSSGFSPNTVVGPDHRLWFATRSGLAVADLEEIGSNRHPPPVTIEGLLVNGEMTPLRDGLELGPDATNLRFEFGAMTYRMPEKVSIYHRMDSVDGSWLLARKGRAAYYDRLPHGDHVLRVRAVNEDGVSSTREAVFTFRIVPHFFQTRGFRAGVFVTGLLILLGITHLLYTLRMNRQTRELRQQAAVQQERVRISRDMHDLLGASLTHISLLTELAAGDKPLDKTQQQVVRAARQAASALDEIVWAVNPRHDHLGSMLEYLSEQAVTLLQPAGIACRLDLPTEVPERPLPAEFRHQVCLIVREALNNVVKHASATQVRLSLDLNDPRCMRLALADNGRGGASLTGGEGLHNMRARASTLGADIEVHSTPGAGTSLELIIPWPREEGTRT